MLYNFEDNYQCGIHSIYHKDFYKSKFIDTEPSYYPEIGTGRIIMVQWNNFLRKIKKYLWQKNKNKKMINNFWKKTRIHTLQGYNPYLGNDNINNIISFI